MMPLRACVLLLALPAAAQQTTIRAWGADAFGPTLTALERAYAAKNAGVTFEDKLTGSGTGMAGIITGVSDITVMGRPANTNEVIGFEWVHRTKPYGIEVATGPLRGEGRSAALTVFVARSNPVRSISTAQLGAILACPATAHAATWALAGARGAFAARPIHVYAYDITSGTGVFLQQTLTPEKDCWNWDAVEEFREQQRAGKAYTASAQIADALRHDANGLAISTREYASGAIRAVALNGVKPSAATLRDGSYLLRRPVFVYVNRKTDAPIDPAVSAFLRFILSPEGQDVVARQGHYLPLSAAAMTAQRKKLE